MHILYATKCSTLNRPQQHRDEQLAIICLPIHMNYVGVVCNDPVVTIHYAL